MTLLDLLANSVQPRIMPLVDRMLVPDSVLRFGMRKLLASTLNMCSFEGDVEKQAEYRAAFVEDLKKRDIAEQTGSANEQHYEVPTEFFKLMLGPLLKYSSGLWESNTSTLEESEEAMLRVFCERAGLHELPAGSAVLDLGCGWGSLTVYASQRFPQLQFTSVSNSATQKAFIDARCVELGVKNVNVKTCDVNVLSFPENTFDRVMSVEMFEHMKNYQKLLANISSWLKPAGKLMIHIFVHNNFSYHFEEGSWMADNFFTGGTMPSRDLMYHFNDDMVVERQWSVNGVHYSRTLEAWLQRMDIPENKSKILKMFKETYPQGEELKRFQAWRIFNMACSELFAYNGGNEWYVSHYLFQNSKQ
jgi:cyclopropane-fatty-acyl-phospholipid synthase